MKVALATLALPAMGWAFPQLAGFNSREEMLNMLKDKREAEELSKRSSPENFNPVDEAELAASDLGLGVVGNVKEKRQVLGGLVGTVAGLTNDIASLTSAIATSIDPSNYRPESGYTFKAPTASDSRGPCPGLNLLANYGYLPRSGLVTFSQVVDATSRGFNMGADLATVLATFAVLSTGDIATESWYLGTGPGDVGGLNRHSTVECDVSPNREDYYLGCGDNHHLSSRLFQQNIACAANSTDKDFGVSTMACQYALNAKFSQKNNPYIYYFPFPSIVSIAAYPFYPNFMSNGTYGKGGVANYESISNIIGAKYNSKTGQFQYVPERWPASGWYRRATPYGATQALSDGFLNTYPSYPLPMPIAQVGSPNLNVTTILCDVVQGFQSVTPVALSKDTQSVEAGVSWALGKLANVGLSATTLGCPSNSLSPNFYANSTQEGGALNPPPSVIANVGNNTYSKTYFCTAPSTPQCSHTC